MDNQSININESSTRHEIGLVWKVLSIVGAVIVALAWPLFLMFSYGTTLETRDTAQTLRIQQNEKDIETTNRRVDALERFKEFHQRNHAQSQGPAWQGRP